jgi:hypothetical protein
METTLLPRLMEAGGRWLGLGAGLDSFMQVTPRELCGEAARLDESTDQGSPE